MTSPRVSHHWALGAALLLLFACGPADQSGSVPAFIHAYDPTLKDYRAESSTLNNLESLNALRGRDVELRSGAGFTGLLMDKVDRGRSFAFSYDLDSSNRAVPASLEDFYAATVYHHLDSVAQTMRDHGHIPSGRIQVFYFPYADNILVGDARLLLMDNAAYVPSERVFLILPSFILQSLPLLLNFGVLGHEFGHSVIQQELFGDNEPELSPVVGRHVASLHEGAADIVGLIVSGDPNYFQPSIETDRDIATPLTYTAADRAELDAPATDQVEAATFDPHWHGSFLARAIHESWPKELSGQVSEAERGRMLDVLLATLRDTGASFVPETFDMGDFLNAWVTHVTPAEKVTTCTVFLTRLAPFASSLTNCPAVP